MSPLAGACCAGIESANESVCLAGKGVKSFVVTQGGFEIPYDSED